MWIHAAGVLLALSVVPSTIEDRARQDAAVIRKYLRDVYNFRPHLLSDREINQESKTLDEFWARAKAQPDVYLPVLRQELATYTGPPFFLYDGSKLLLSLSDTADDRRLAVSAIARCDLRDVQSLDYLRTVHRLAARGEDVTQAAFHILARPSFTAFVAQHVLTLGQDYSLVVMLLPMDAERWVGPAIQQLEAEPNPTSQKSLLLALWYAQTDEADNALSAFAGFLARGAAANRAYTPGSFWRGIKAPDVGPPARYLLRARRAFARVARTS